MKTPLGAAVTMAVAFPMGLLVVQVVGWRDPGIWDYLIAVVAGFAGGFLGATVRQNLQRNR